jgi:hypothetical protein
MDMGFFSQECHGCHMSVLAPYNLMHGTRWMNRFVAVQKDGVIASGHYDGYGRNSCADEYDTHTDEYWDQLESEAIDDAVIGTTWDEDGNPNASGPTVWHQACWLAAGKPTDWKGESPHASDQGYFYDDADYSTRRPPKSAAGLARLARAGERLRERRQREEARELAR